MTASPPPDLIDLRSDTVTRPSPAMRQAMAEAPVGDDVFGEDPTVNVLQERVAEILGKESALFVPSGSMANQIAIRIQTHHGDEALVGRDAHSWLFESGATAALAGVQPCIIGRDGRFSADDVRAALKPDDHHHAPTRLVMVENTHNMGGGLIWPPEETTGVVEAAHELGLGAHLDGARLWNAAAKSGLSEEELASGFDTVSVCLSKGLGAPVGSVLAGSATLMRRAHRVRKMFGGAMRQAGILAAAGLYAIDHHRGRLAEDHENAAQLARAIHRPPGLVVDLSRVHTNIIIAEVDPEVGPADELERRARQRGLLFLSLGPRRFRMVTHLDVDRRACERAAEILGELVRT